MKIKNYTLLILMVVAILVIGGIILKNSLMHRDILDKQAVKNTELLKYSFLNQYKEYSEALIDKIQVDKLDDTDDFKEYYIQENIKDYIEPEERDSSERMGRKDLSFFSSGKLIHFRSKKDNPKKNDRVFIPIEKLFVKYEPYQFFNRILLTDEQGVVKWSNGDFFGTKLLEFEKIGNKDLHTFSVKKGTILLNNEPYLVYYTQLEIDGLKCNLAGVISEAKFNSVGYRIDHTLTTYLVFLLMLVLASIPIISVLSLKKGDVLTKSKVYSCGLSLLAILLFLGGFTSMNLSQIYSDKENQILTEFGKIDIDSAKVLYSKRILEIGDMISSDYPFKEFLKEELPNQVIKVSSIGYLKQVEDNECSLTPLDSTIDLSNRAYVKYFSDTTYYSNAKYIGSHYSRLDGHLESVVSKKGANDIEAINFSFINQVRDTLLHPIDNRNSILIIKKDGKLIHKSRKITSPIDSLQQFISGDNWLQIKYILENNSHVKSSNDTWQIPLHLDGLDFTAYISLIPNTDFDQPLWFVYLKNQNPDEIKSTLVSIEAGVYFVLYIVLLLVISLLTKIFKPAKPKYNWNAFSYGFLKPDGKNESNYILLLIIFIITGIGMFFVLNKSNVVGSVYIISMTLFFVSIIIRIFISPDKSSSRPEFLNKSMTWIFLGILIIIAIVCTLIYRKYFEVQIDEWIFVAISFVFLIIVLLLNFFRSDTFRFLEKYNFKIDLNGLFSMFLFSWFVLVGFLPGLFINEKIANYEEIVWQKFGNDSEGDIVKNLGWIVGFEKSRRIFFSSISSPFYEPEVRSFISPERNLLESAMLKPTKSFEFNLFPILIIFLSLGLIYILTYFLVKKLFWLDNGLYLFQKNFFQFQKNRNHKLSGLNIFLCGLNTELCREYIAKHLYQNHTLEVFDCSHFSDLNSAFGSSDTNVENKIWLIQNIHCLKDQTILIRKLPYLITESKKNEITLVVSSGVSWKGLVKTLPDPELQTIYSEIFSSFYFDYVPIQRVPTLFEDLNSEKHTSSSNIGYFDEYSVMGFLRQNLNECDMHMNFNLYIQRFGKAYFMNIWTELSFDEKKICFYYCKEGLVNYANYDLFVELLQKGIFHICEKTKKIKIFSDGFRSFVLSQISVELLDDFNRDQRENGNHTSIEVAIVSFIFIIFAILSFFDRNFLNQTSSLVTGAVGLLGGLYSLVGRLFPNSQVKE